MARHKVRRGLRPKRSMRWAKGLRWNKQTNTHDIKTSSKDQRPTARIAKKHEDTKDNDRHDNF